MAPASNVTPRPPPPPENNKRKADLEDPSVVVTKEPRTEAAALQTRAAAFAAMRVWPLEHYFCAPMKIVALLRA